MEISLSPVKDEDSKDKAKQPAKIAAAALPDQTPEEEKETKITIILPRNAYFMSGIRDFTLQMVMNMTGFSEQWAFRFQSVVDELCNNAIEHGSGPGSSVKATFISSKDEYIEIRVEDSQTGKTKMTAEEMYKTVEKNKAEDPLKTGSIRGRGLAYIVSNWTDELIFEDIEGGGLRVRAKKLINKS